MNIASELINKYGNEVGFLIKPTNNTNPSDWKVVPYNPGKYYIVAYPNTPLKMSISGSHHNRKLLEEIIEVATILKVLYT